MTLFYLYIYLSIYLPIYLVETSVVLHGFLAVSPGPRPEQITKRLGIMPSSKIDFLRLSF
jgi:hypothetical protein